jgi:hypothetical protein
LSNEIPARRKPNKTVAGKKPLARTEHHGRTVAVRAAFFRDEIFFILSSRVMKAAYALFFP